MKPLPLCAADAVTLHDAALALADWPRGDVEPQQPAPPSSVWAWITANHRFNSLLWAEEDLARRTSVSDAEIVANKRAIDRFNQARNDATERIDELLLEALGLPSDAGAGIDSLSSRPPVQVRLNSETAGSILDRMSIMALKIHAMRLQTLRQDVDDGFLALGQERLQRLLAQRGDLARCLDELLADSATGLAFFKVYRQFKMYNDSRFSPPEVLARAGQAADPPAHRGIADNAASKARGVPEAGPEGPPSTPARRLPPDASGV